MNLTLQRCRLRPGWASDLAAAISRRTERDEERDAVQRLWRAMRWWAPELARLGREFDAAAESLLAFAKVWRRESSSKPLTRRQEP